MFERRSGQAWGLRRSCSINESHKEAECQVDIEGTSTSKTITMDVSGVGTPVSFSAENAEFSIVKAAAEGMSCAAQSVETPER